jgi:hypothetical protein
MTLRLMRFRRVLDKPGDALALKKSILFIQFDKIKYNQSINWMNQKWNALSYSFIDELTLSDTLSFLLERMETPDLRWKNKKTTLAILT